jgi:hypothetical protein
MNWNQRFYNLADTVLARGNYGRLYLYGVHGAAAEMHV